MTICPACGQAEPLPLPPCPLCGHRIIAHDTTAGKKHGQCSVLLGDLTLCPCRPRSGDLDTWEREAAR